MAVVPLGDAFDFWPTAILRLGTEEVSIPPLSLGRFLELTGPKVAASMPSLFSQSVTLLDELLHADPTKRQTAAAAMAHISPTVLWPIARAIVPRLPAHLWIEHGGIWELAEIGAFLKDVHDWELIGEEMGIKDEHQEASAFSIQKAITIIAKATGRPFESIIDLRLEGFFHLKRGLRQVADEDEPTPSSPEAAGVIPFRDPERKAGIWSQLDNADRGRPHGDAS